MIKLVETVASNGYVWRALKVDSGSERGGAAGSESVARRPLAELHLEVSEAGLGTLKITTDASLDTPTFRRIFEQLVVKVFDAALARRLQVVALGEAQVLALEKTGFALSARQPANGTRLAATKLSVAEAMSIATMARHIDVAVWGFRFDNGKRRAGQCNYSERVISISKHLVAHHSLDDVQQVVLHEIAHAMVGKEAGHGPIFRSQAALLGYRGKTFTGREIAANEASWVGLCKAGHVHYRYRKPTRPLACGLCSKTFSRANQIVWQRSEAS